MSPAQFPEDAETYLSQLGRELHPLPAGERTRILQEIGGHLAERAEVGPEMLHATIVGLGTPRSLAQGFMDDRALAGALEKRSNLRLLWVILRRAVRGVGAAVVGTAGALLYLLSIGFALVAVIKPILPAQTGMWLDPNGGVSNFGVMGDYPRHEPEILGWWIIPISLAAAVALWLMAGWVLRRGGRLLLRKSA
jgi:hypothetical protein